MCDPGMIGPATAHNYVGLVEGRRGLSGPVLSTASHPGVMLTFRASLVFIALVVPPWAWVHAYLEVDELPDLTGGVIPLLYPVQVFGGGGELNSGGRLSTRLEALYEVRVKNQSGDPVEADSLVVVVHKIQERARLRDVMSEVEFVGADGETGDGKPYFRVPMGGQAELEPYAESEPFTLEIQNPNMLRLFPPVLRVRGIRRTASQDFQKALQNLLKQGVISPEEAQESLESSSY